MILSFEVQFVLVFLALIVVDFCWTFYIAKVAEGKAFAAACWSAMIMVIGAFTTISYLEDKRLLIAAILGAWIGTFLAVKLKKPELADK